MHTASIWPMTTWQTTREQATQTSLVRATDDRLGSPPHPWYKRLKNIEAERSQAQAQREVQIPVRFSSVLWEQDAQEQTSNPYQAMYDDPALSALFDMPDWLGGLLGVSAGFHHRSYRIC